jgi:peroxiredoxin
MRRSSVIVLLLVAVVIPVHATDVRPAAGHRAPDFTLRDVNGTPVQLSRVVGAKAVLLNFWATWCPPCREEMPTMEQAYRDYRAKGLEVLAVSVDAGDEKSVAPRVRRFMAELGLTFPALLDLKGEVVRAYRCAACRRPF